MIEWLTHTHTYNWITFLYSRNWHNIVNQLYFNFFKKGIQIRTKRDFQNTSFDLCVRPFPSSSFPWNLLNKSGCLSYKIYQELADCMPTESFTSSPWCSEIKFYDLSPILQVRKLRLREYMPCQNLYNQRSSRAQAACLPSRKEKKKKKGTSSSEPLVQYLACTYWTVKRAASGQPVNTDSTDLANHEANLSLPWVLLFIFIFCHTTRPVGS